VKKLLVVLPIALLLLTFTIGAASAGYAYEDPALCVAGQWLVVNAAHPSAVTVSVPKDVPYGDQQAGGCSDSNQDIPLLNVVRERGDEHNMFVKVEGKDATTPSVTVSYGDVEVTRKNSGKGILNFKFSVPNSDD
jgi:hypothetical protein